MDKPLIDPETTLFTLGDVKQLYISMRRRLLKWIVIGSVGAFFGFGIIAPKYKIEASFKESAEQSMGGTEGVLKEILGGMSSSPQPQAASFMKSFQVLRPLVERIGLQVGQRKPGWVVGKVFKRYSDNLKAEKGIPLAETESFEFRDVLYEGEKAIPFLLCFTDLNQFTVYSADKRTPLCEGTVGAEIKFLDGLVRLTVKQAPKDLKLDVFYSFTVAPWIDAAKSLRSELRIISDQRNKSIYNITLVARDRHAGTQIINELMNQYQLYLKREFDQMAKQQLSYLENKQGQIYEKLGGLLDEHVDYYRRNLSENGFVSAEEQSRELLGFYQAMHTKILAIDTNLSRIDQMENKDEPMLGLAREEPFSEQFTQIAQNIRELQQQKDLLEASLSLPNQDIKSPFVEDSLQVRREELREVRHQRYAVEAVLDEIDSGKEIASFDLRGGPCLWAGSLRNAEEKEDLRNYLENYVRLLSVREKIIQEGSLYEKNRSLELEGIDLETARALLIQYNNQLDRAESLMRHYAEYKERIADPEFELASLAPSLEDPMSRKLIDQASSLWLQLKDDKHRSPKESDRWQEEISLHKKVLVSHLDQLYKVESLNASLFREKMRDLQKISLDCINRQISVLHEQAESSIKDCYRNLVQEKKLLEKRMEEIRESAVNLPDKWRLEKWLTIKTDLVAKVMETITGVVESKSVANHLHRVASKPLDPAIVPLVAEKPHLYAKTFLGGVLSAVFLFVLTFFRRLLQGFPLSLEKLKALRLPVLGSISSLCDGPAVETVSGPDLDLLRRLSFFAEGGKVIGLLAGDGPDYSYALGENLARMSVKSVILRCDFLSKFRSDSCPGLLQVWKEEVGELPLRKGKGFDYITAGGFSSFGAEIIQSPHFGGLVEALKKNYDRVFLLFRGTLSSAESVVALHLCDKAVVTVSKEQTEELTPFINWAYHKDHCRLTFITKV